MRSQHVHGKASTESVMCLTNAARYLEISDPTLRRLVRSGQLTVFDDPLDGRRKLVRRVEVERLLAERQGVHSVKEVADAA